MVKIAKDTNRFTFLTECTPDVKIVIGDARLTLSDQPDGQFDMILIDAFSSDAIPTHLLTKEAMAIYKNKIKPDGLILMHISNKHMALQSAVAGIAKANGLVWRARAIRRKATTTRTTFSARIVVAVAPNDAALGALAKAEGWDPVRPDDDKWVWTDDYSNVIGAILKKLKGRVTRRPLASFSRHPYPSAGQIVPSMVAHRARLGHIAPADQT